MPRCIVILLLMLGALPAAEEVFIITAFRPFMGRGKNASETILNSLKQDPDFAKVQLRVLDVGWDKVRDVIAELSPAKLRGIIGLGEGHKGFVAIELYGRNVANGTDEFGVAKGGEVIAAGKPAQARSRILFQLRSEAEYPVPIVISNNAGEFLCNYALFQYNQLDARVSGFIHVPPQESVPDEAYLHVIRPVVVDILKQNLAKQRLEPLNLR